MITEGSEVAGAPGSSGLARSQRVGTIAEVRSAEQFDDGRWVLLAAGLSRAVLGGIDDSGPYALVDAAPLPEVTGVGAERLVPDVQVELDRYLATVKRFVATAASESQPQEEMTDVTASLDTVLKPIRLPDDPLAASYAVGGMLQVELTRKQQLLELPDAASRLRAELQLLRRESRLLADGALPPIAPADLRYNPN
jgi:Lon protease-like protein